jgi:serine/threonine protein kinase
MAPEAIEFSPDIDGRADVYGFGVLFFEALTGKLPFPGPPGLELFKRILTDPAAQGDCVQARSAIGCREPDRLCLGQESS